MSVAVRVRGPSATREYREAELPLVLGSGRDATLPLMDPELPARAAVLGRRQDRFYLQAVPGVESLMLNGEAIAGVSAWLTAGDRIAIGADRYTVEVAGEVLELAAEGLAEAITVPPVLIDQVPDRARPPTGDEVLKPAAFHRATGPVPRTTPGARWRLKAGLWAGAVVLLALAAFVFTATPVRIEVVPDPEQFTLRGGLLTPKLAGRHLLRPGRYSVLARRDGYTELEREFEVVAGGATEFRFLLERLPDLYAITSGEVFGAQVVLDGTEVGTTPLADLALAAGPRRLRLEADGYAPRDLVLEVEGGGRHVALDLELEELRVQVEAPLPSPGIEPERIPEPAPAARAAPPAAVAAAPATDAALPVEAVAVAAPSPGPERIRTSQGAELVLVQPGRFTMGASRREPGRRANENLREVELTRAFYIGTTPVTNAEFAAFDRQHRSGTAGRHGLDGARQPVVRVSWRQAAAYCNWLSAQDGLQPAYRQAGETWELVEPPAVGYRLPTEAEWAWAARYGSQAVEPPRYPWGAALPPPERSGNYADESARELLGAVIARYQDGYPATAPVGSFPPNRLGLFDAGGNVAEWTGDFYGVYPPSDELLVDPRGPSGGRFRVIRGSGWMHHGATELRLSYRDYGDEPRADLGFRIARDME